jgi:heptosyltransferase-2
MLGILHLDGAPHRYGLELTDDERRRGLEHLRGLGVNGRPMVGFNTGAGGRWQLKQWREDGFQELAARLVAEGVQVVLLGGPSEQERNDRLKAAVPEIIDPGSDNPVRHFASLVAACDVVVTGDTLAMHIALATRRRTIVLFGPTSAAEIELYGLGEKILPALSCLACYKNTCDFVPNCMDEISCSAVFAAVRRQLAVTSTSGQ